MELLTASSATFSPLPSNFSSFTFKATISKSWKSHPGIVEARLQGFLLRTRTTISKRLGICCNSVGPFKEEFLFQHFCQLNKGFSSQCGLISIRYRSSLVKVRSCSDRIRQCVSVLFVQLVFTAMLVTSTTIALSETPSLALSEENRLFLEAWRTIDRAYVDKTFNGQSWFRYRENALRNEPMNTREETCAENILFFTYLSYFAETHQRKMMLK